jgi:hypothetical protein
VHYNSLPRTSIDGALGDFHSLDDRYDHDIDELVG